MNDSVNVIPFSQLAISFIPVIVVIGIFIYWSLDWKRPLQAVIRMLVQLLLIGYLLTYIFGTDQPWIVLLVITVMITASSWIALGVLDAERGRWFVIALTSIAMGGGFVLVLITAGVLQLQPWYLPRYMVPLAGMVFANGMNSVSLALDRLLAEQKAGRSFVESRGIAFRTAMIPNVNALMAVGLVSLPGMMTGQILSGVPALIAVRYQIMAMCMVFGSAGLSTAIFLIQAKKRAL